jgi:hypothetical protein
VESSRSDLGAGDACVEAEGDAAVPDDKNCTNGGNYNWLTADSNPVHGVKWVDSRNTS